MSEITIPQVAPLIYLKAFVAAWDIPKESINKISSLWLDAIQTTTQTFQYFEKHFSETFKKNVIQPLVKNADKMAFVRKFIAVFDLLDGINDLVAFCSKHDNINVSKLISKLLDLLNTILSLVCFTCASLAFFTPFVSLNVLISIEIITLISYILKFIRGVFKYQKTHDSDLTDLEKIKQSIKANYLIFGLARGAYYMLLSCVSIMAFISVPMASITLMVEYALVTGISSVFLEWIYYGCKTVWKEQERLLEANKI
jgi:hypothetical protein